MTENLTSQLADFVVAQQLEDLADSARERARIVLIDTVASALMGVGDPNSARIEKLAMSVAGPGKSPVVGGTGLANAGAVLMNGYLINAATVCDIHDPTRCHTTPASFPPALAVGAERGVSGADFFLAFTLGLEMAIRVGMGSNYPAFRANGWHSPGVWGPFGAVTAAGKLLGLDTLQMRNAFGLAGSQSGGTFAAWGSPTVKFHQSRGALSGFLAATLAETGFESAVDVLTSEDGGLYRSCSDGGRPDLALDGLGVRWELENLSLSEMPLGRTLQSVAIAIMSLAGTAEVRPATVSHARVALSPASHEMHETMPWNDPFHARLSAPYVAAVVLADNACGPDQFTLSRLADADVARYARNNVKVVADGSLQGDSAVVELELSDGRTVRESCSEPPGSPRAPLSLADVREKFLAAAARLDRSEWAERALGRLERIEEVPTVDAELVGSLP